MKPAFFGVNLDVITESKGETILFYCKAFQSNWTPLKKS